MVISYTQHTHAQGKPQTVGLAIKRVTNIVCFSVVYRATSRPCWSNLKVIGRIFRRFPHCFVVRGYGCRSWTSRHTCISRWRPKLYALSALCGCRLSMHQISSPTAAATITQWSSACGIMMMSMSTHVNPVPLWERIELDGTNPKRAPTSRLTVNGVDQSVVKPTTPI